MSEPRYVYDTEQGFIVDTRNPQPGGFGYALMMTDVVDLLNALEAKLSKMEEILDKIRGESYMVSLPVSDEIDEALAGESDAE